MYKKCWGCNGDNIFITAWLAGEDFCSNCKNNLLSPSVTANYKINSERIARDNETIKSYGEKIPVIQENIKIILGLLFTMFVLWVLFGGLLEDNNTPTISVDCSKPSAKYDKYCNGEVQSENQEQDYYQNSYYQNIVR